MSWYATRPRRSGKVTDIREARTKIRPGLFYQFAAAKPGDTFEHHGTEFTVDNVVASPSGGYEVAAHPSAVISDGRDE